MRYLAVSAFCAALHNAIMIGLDFAGVHYGLSLLASAVVLVPTGYFALARFTFEARCSRPAFARYAGVVLVNTPGSFIALWALYDTLGLPMWIAAPVATIILMIWNYLTSRWAIGGVSRSGPSINAGAAR